MDSHTAFQGVELLAARQLWANPKQPLAGLLRWGHCGSLIQPSWTKNHGREYRYYTYAKRVKTGYGNCPLSTLPAGEIEEAIVTEVGTLLRHRTGAPLPTKKSSRIVRKKALRLKTTPRKILRKVLASNDLRESLVARRQGRRAAARFPEGRRPGSLLSPGR